MQEHIPVLIIGGGPTGLSAAVFLARHGVPVTVVERRTDALGHPRARAINPRTVELFRDAGLEPEILSECSRVYDENSQLIRARSLPSPELRRTSMARPHSAAGTAGVSPCAWAPIDQDRLEILLREHARKLGADLRFGSRLLDFADFGGDGVDARIEDADGVHDVRADLLIAADGHRSGVREALGIGFTGPGALGSSANFVFTADLEAQLRGRNLGVGHFDLPRPGTVLLPHDGTGRWVLGIPYHPAAGESLDDFTPRRCAELAAAAVGARPADITIVPQLGNGTTVLGYEVEARVAERLRSGPVFLIGDAAHVMPPTGAFGASTGIQDAHNLAWKIAAVLAGRAGPGLLDTYEAERLPVARFTVEQALLQLRERTGRDVPLPADARPADGDAVVFGQPYASAAIAAGPDAAVPGTAFAPEELSGRPGTRAPHLWVRRDGRTVSTLDLYGRCPVLLTGPDGAAWADALKAAAADLGVDAAAHIADGDLTEVTGRLTDGHGIGPAGALLVRPDGYVAWRSPGPPVPDAPAAPTLRTVLRTVLSLDR